MVGSLSSGLGQAVASAVLLIAMLVLYLRRFAPSWRWVAVALGVCVVDQAAKMLVSPDTEYHRIPVLGGWLQITYLENVKQGFGGSFPYLLLVTGVCVAALFFLYGRLSETKYRMSALAEVGCALMVGGYLGILLDRVRLGFVVDFLEVGRAGPFVYNLADLAIFVAVALLLVRGLQYLAQARAKGMGMRDEVI